MKFLKNNFKLIIGFIVGVILASSITVYATSYFAKDISYERTGTDIKNVADALNDLYEKVNVDIPLNLKYGKTEINTNTTLRHSWDYTTSSVGKLAVVIHAGERAW